VLERPVGDVVELERRAELPEDAMPPCLVLGSLGLLTRGLAFRPEARQVPASSASVSFDRVSDSWTMRSRRSEPRRHRTAITIPSRTRRAAKADVPTAVQAVTSSSPSIRSPCRETLPV
jgi:hypothetical protein